MGKKNPEICHIILPALVAKSNICLFSIADLNISTVDYTGNRRFVVYDIIAVLLIVTSRPTSGQPYTPNSVDDNMFIVLCVITESDGCHGLWPRYNICYPDIICCSQSR